VAYVLFNSWAGRTKARVTIIKKCGKRSQVRFEEPAFGRAVGHVQYVPNHAIAHDKFGDGGQPQDDCRSEDDGYVESA
jgi:hypothetical protein